MAKIDLSGLTLKELKALNARVEKAIERHDKKQRSDALSMLKAKAKEMGFSLDDLTGGAAADKPKAQSKRKASAKKKPAAAYRDPENPKNTYGGRGPRPKWLKDALASGKKLDDFKA